MTEATSIAMKDEILIDLGCDWKMRIFPDGSGEIFNYDKPEQFDLDADAIIGLKRALEQLPG